MHTTFITDLRRDALFHPRGALGRRRARVEIVISCWALAPAEPLRGRARDAVFCHAFNTNRRLDRVACNAPLGKLAAPRHQAGSTLPKWVLLPFPFLEARLRFSKAFSFWR